MSRMSGGAEASGRRGKGGPGQCGSGHAGGAREGGGLDEFAAVHDEHRIRETRAARWQGGAGEAAQKMPGPLSVVFHL